MNSLEGLKLRRLIAEIATDTVVAYGVSALAPPGDKSDVGGPGSKSVSEEDELDEEDLLSFTKADRELDNRGKKMLWRRDLERR